MKVAITKNSDPCATAVFTWSDDLQDCDVLAVGIEDGELDALIAAKAHEGAEVDGYTTEIE